jgi:hypothetical protein
MLEFPFVCPRCKKKQTDYVQFERPILCFACQGWIKLDVDLKGNTLVYTVEPHEFPGAKIEKKQGDE